MSAPKAKHASVIAFATQKLATADGSETEQLIERWYAVGINWRDLTLELSAKLWAARQRYPDNQEFGEWLDRHARRLSKNDRAALIKMGQHLEISRKVLEQSNRQSPQHIWQELVKPRLLLSSSTEEDAIPTTALEVATDGCVATAEKDGTATTASESLPGGGAVSTDKKATVPRPKTKIWGNAEHTEAQFTILVNSVKAFFGLIKDKELLAAKLQFLVSKIVPGATVTFPDHEISGHQSSAVRQAKRDVAKALGHRTFDDVEPTLGARLLKDQLAPAKTKEN
jgi:hypothetical protein